MANTPIRPEPTGTAPASQTRRPGRARAAGLSLRARLVLLVAAIALPLIGLGVEAIWQGYRSDRARAGTVLVDETRALAQAVDGEFARTRATLIALSLSRSLAGDDLQAFDGELTDASGRMDGQPLLLFAPDGTPLFNTTWPAGEKPANLRRSALARRASETGQTLISGLQQDGLTGRWYVAVYLPIAGLDAQGFRQTRHVLGGGIWAERLSALLRHQQRESATGTIAAILDPNGQLVARTLDEARSVGRTARPEIIQQLRTEDHGLMDGAPSLEGVPGVLAFAHASVSQYIVAISLPRSSFEAPLRAALLRLLGFGSLLLGAGLAAAYGVARGIVRSLQRLAHAAAHGGTATGLPEVDRLAGALAEAAAERNRAEAALQAANAELSNVLESIGDGFYAVDANWRFVYANRRALDLFAVTEEQALGRNFYSLFPKVLGSELQTQYEAVVADGKAREFRAVSPVLQRWTAYNVYPRQGGGIAVYFRDISQQMHAELALRASEARLRLAQRIGGLGSFDWTPGEPAVLSEEYVSIHGLPAGTSVGQWPELLGRVHPEDRAGFAAGIQTALESAPSYDVEFRIIRPSDGAVRWLVSRAEIFRDGAGKAIRVSGVVQDVTAWREVQRRQDEALALLNSLLDNAPVGFAFFDREHRYVRLNGALAAMNGLPAEAHLGRSIREVAPDSAAAIEAVVDEVFRSGLPVYDLDITAAPPGQPGNTRYWHVGFYPVPDPAGGVLWVGAALLDVTERRHDQEQLRRLNEELEQRVRSEVAAREEAQNRLAHAERMQALGQLAGGIAHDFNNVLQAVSGSAALIERRPGDLPGVLRLTRRIMDAAERGGSTTRRLLAFARRDELRAERVDVTALLGGVQEMIAPVLGRTLAVQVDCAENLPAVLADRGQLETVLVNLAVNARDAMPEGGSLRLHAEQRAVAAAPPHPAGLAPGSYVRIAVSDSGHGMDAATLARATEPFFTTKEKGKGTGLGLAMARGFAEQSGGGLEIDSAPGRGTTVTLWLPAMAPEMPAGEADPQVAARRNILLVDDDELVRETVAAQLEDAGYAVLAAEGAAEALAALESGSAPDLLLTDFSMPGMDGLALIRAARRRRPELPSILLTGFAGEAEGLAGRSRPDRFVLLRKPADERELVAQIEALLQAA